MSSSLARVWDKTKRLDYECISLRSKLVESIIYQSGERAYSWGLELGWTRLSMHPRTTTGTALNSIAFPTIAERVLYLKWPSRLNRKEEEESLKIQVILSRDPLPCARRLLVTNDAGRRKNLGRPVVIGGNNMPSPSWNRVNWLPNIGGSVPPSSQYRHHCWSNQDIWALYSTHASYHDTFWQLIYAILEGVRCIKKISDFGVA